MKKKEEPGKGAGKENTKRGETEEQAVQEKGSQ